MQQYSCIASLQLFKYGTLYKKGIIRDGKTLDDIGTFFLQPTEFLPHAGKVLAS
jgi:hypothetical protein